MIRVNRPLLRTAACAAVAFSVVAGSVLADELLGLLTKVDVEKKTITVVEKGTDKEVVVKITDDTEQETRKGAQKVDLEKLEKFVTKVQESGKKGIGVTVTHKDGTASKLKMQFGAGKKGAPRKKGDGPKKDE